MRIITEEEAKKLICPILSGQCTRYFCWGKGCFAWQELYPEITRENHSGARQMMDEENRKRKGSFQEVISTGHGCTGLLTLSAMGTCRKIYKGEIEIKL